MAVAGQKDIIEQHNQDATLFVGNLDDRVDDELLWELFLQMGPVVSVHLPRDAASTSSRGFAFVEYRSELDADYALRVLSMVRLFGKPLRINKAGQQQRVEVGANLFIGNLAPEVDEKELYDVFSAFGTIASPTKVVRDLETGATKGYGFVAFDSFEAADLAIESMNGQFLFARPIVVQYAFKKDSHERHGSQAERLIAASSAAAESAFKPHTLFAEVPGQVIIVGPTPGLLVGQEGAARGPRPGAFAGASGVGTGVPSLGGYLPPPLPPAAPLMAADDAGYGMPPPLPSTGSGSFRADEGVGSGGSGGGGGGGGGGGSGGGSGEGGGGSGGYGGYGAAEYPGSGYPGPRYGYGGSMAPPPPPMMMMGGHPGYGHPPPLPPMAPPPPLMMRPPMPPMPMPMGGGGGGYGGPMPMGGGGGGGGYGGPMMMGPPPIPMGGGFGGGAFGRGGPMPPPLPPMGGMMGGPPIGSGGGARPMGGPMP